MADVKWIKLATDIFDNRKIRQIECLPDGDSIIVVWVKLMCLAGNINDSGFVYFTKEIPYTDQMLAAQFNRPLTTVQLALKTFEQFGMIEVIDNVLHISNWEKYQSVDRLAEIREYNRLAKQKSRAKQKLLPAVNDKSMTSQCCHDTDKEEDKEKDKELDKKKKNKPAETPYGEYQNVLLTENEYENLANSFGYEMVKKAIAFLDEYIEEKGYKSKSHNLAIRRWVIDAVKEKEPKGKRKEPVPNWCCTEDEVLKYIDDAPKTAKDDPEIAAKAAKLQEDIAKWV